jgi:hypothetical protein
MTLLNNIYDCITRDIYSIDKSIIFYKEYDSLQTITNINRINNLINSIEETNKNKYFLKYQYRIQNNDNQYILTLSSINIPTLNDYIYNYGFSKRFMDCLVNNVCEALDTINYHGHLSLDNIYTDYYTFYLSDKNFYNILYDYTNQGIKKDLYDLTLILKDILPNHLKNNTFIEKGLNKQYCSTKEYIDNYNKYMIKDFNVKGIRRI